MKDSIRAEKIIRPFTDPRVTLWLFAILVLFLVPSTLVPGISSWFLLPAKGVLALLVLNLLVCTISRFQALRPATLIIHIGTIITLIGGLVSGAGFVATVNIYEGTSSGKAFRWDRGKDEELGFDLRVVGLHYDLYPVPVKVGILRNGEKAGLVQVRTGEAFAFENYAVKPMALDPLRKEMSIEVRDDNGELIGSMVTGGRRDLPQDFLLDFRLVAYQDPVARRMWVDLELQSGGRVVAAGTSEVNSPLRWRGMQFFLTSVDVDDFGRPYAGIQISRDPGLPFVYGGTALLCLGLLLALKRWTAVQGKTDSR